jgi:glycosyltransferase involved in cell wall biosynthesis
MNEKVGASKFIVVEGIARDAFVARQTEERLQKTILYTGGLNQKYGITTLVDAFMQIEDPEYRLILCGSGDAVPYINNAQRKDSRIEYKGLVRHDETLSLQMKATVLVNPRQNTEEFTKYSFPSKNLEYLASGTPVIAYKLDGIPDEYDDYFLYVSDNSVAALRNKIEEVCSLSEQERIRFGQRARRFVLEEKNCEKQAQRMLDFVRSIRFP